MGRFVILLLAAAACMQVVAAITGDEDYYELLGIDRDATSAQVRDMPVQDRWSCTDLS